MNFLKQEDLPRFKKAYEQALAEGKEIFEFDKVEILVTYAYYVLEYAEGLKGGKE